MAQRAALETADFQEPLLYVDLTVIVDQLALQRLGFEPNCSSCARRRRELTLLTGSTACTSPPATKNVSLLCCSSATLSPLLQLGVDGGSTRRCGASTAAG